MADWGAFVGREGELSRLQSALAGRVRLVLVIGDAGIGKTRFVDEGLSRAAGGMLTINGGCLPLAEKLPLLPVADALEELSRLDGGAPFFGRADPSSGPGQGRGFRSRDPESSFAHVRSRYRGPLEATTGLLRRTSSSA